VAALAQVTDFREHALLARIWFDVLADRAETESEPDIPDTLATAAFVPHRIPRPFPDSFTLRLAHRRHDGDEHAAGGWGRVERFRNRDQRDAALLEEFQQAAAVFDGARQPVESSNDNRLDFGTGPPRRPTLQAGRFRFLADSPPSTMTSNNSAPCTVAIARILTSWASSETPCSACLF
jgi:hypothetical protein